MTELTAVLRNVFLFIHDVDHRGRLRRFSKRPLPRRFFSRRSVPESLGRGDFLHGRRQERPGVFWVMRSVGCSLRKNWENIPMKKTPSPFPSVSNPVSTASPTRLISAIIISACMMAYVAAHHRRGYRDIRSFGRRRDFQMR